MKYAITALLLSFCHVTIAQNITYGGAKNQIVHNRGGSADDSMTVIPVFQDTSSANLYGDNFRKEGRIIVTKNPFAFWYNLGSRWKRLVEQSVINDTASALRGRINSIPIPGIDTILSGAETKKLFADRTINLNNKNLAFNNGGVGFGNLPTYQVDIKNAIGKDTVVRISDSSEMTLFSVKDNGDAYIEGSAVVKSLQGGTNALLQTASNGTISRTTITPSSVVSTSGGTANYFAKFNSNNSISPSIIYDNGVNLGIGTNTPLYRFDINGTMRIDNVAANEYLLFSTSGTNDFLLGSGGAIDGNAGFGLYGYKNEGFTIWLNAAKRFEISNIGSLSLYHYSGGGKRFLTVNNDGAVEAEDLIIGVETGSDTNEYLHIEHEGVDYWLPVYTSLP